MCLQHPTEPSISVSMQQMIIIIAVIIGFYYCPHINSLLKLDFMSYKQETVSLILKFHCSQKYFLCFCLSVVCMYVLLCVPAHELVENNAGCQSSPTVHHFSSLYL